MADDKSEKRIIPGKNGGWRPGAGRHPIGTERMRTMTVRVQEHERDIVRKFLKLYRAGMINIENYELDKKIDN